MLAVAPDGCTGSVRRIDGCCFLMGTFKTVKFGYGSSIYPLAGKTYWSILCTDVV